MTVPDRENEAWGREVPGIPPTVTGGLKAGKPWPHRAPRPAPAPPAHPGFSRPRKHVPRQGPPSHTRAREEPRCPRGGWGNCGGPGGAAKLTPEQIAIRCPRRDATVPKFSRDLAQTTQNPHTHTQVAPRLPGTPLSGLASHVTGWCAASPRAGRSTQEGFQF